MREGKWSDVVFTFGNDAGVAPGEGPSALTLYIDGELVGTQSVPASVLKAKKKSSRTEEVIVETPVRVLPSAQCFVLVSHGVVYLCP